jgi:hypothetical protein
MVNSFATIVPQTRIHQPPMPVNAWPVPLVKRRTKVQASASPVKRASTVLSVTCVPVACIDRVGMRSLR